uniref:Protocadherin-16-like n=1 Tax=Macrostomum lignano TaxID=282301 RepID=A0A1I8F1C4_9PLAT
RCCQSTAISVTQLLLLLLLSLAAAAVPAASTSGHPVIDLSDDTPAGVVLDNLDRRFNLGGSQTAWSLLKVMNLPNSAGSVIVDGLAINRTSAELYTLRRLDRDDLCRPASSAYGQRRQRQTRHPAATPCSPANCLCPSSGRPGSTRIEELVLRLADDNDNRPTFSSSSATLQVAEGEKSPARLSGMSGADLTLSLTAADPDQGANGRVEYRLVNAEAGEDLPFSLDKDSDGRFKRMSVVTNRVLDREEKDRYTLHLLAVDSGRNQLTGTLTLNVLVTDVNDERPVFEQGVYHSQPLREDSPVGSPVATVLATDKDFGQNGVVDYSLTGGRHAGMFRVTRTADGRGAVSLARRIDAESAKLDPASGEAVLELLVVATDRGSPRRSSEAKLVVTVTDVNDETPEVTVIYFSNDPQQAGRGLVAENTPNSARPRRRLRPGGEVDCKLSDTPGADGLLVGGFVLSASTSSSSSQRDRMYTLRSTRSLDREQRPTLELAVVCTDRGHRRATIRLRIVDQNDNAPRFLVPPGGAFRFHLPENEPRQQRRSLGFVTAKDADEEPNNKLVYSLLPTSPASWIDGAFQIDASTGEMFAVRPFDREDPRLAAPELLTGASVAAGRRSEAQVTLQVFGVGLGPTHTDTATVVVTIEDRNDNAPRFRSSEYKFRVAEEAKDYRKVGTVAADDADESDASAIEYRIDHDVDHEIRRLFRLDQTTGTINLLDRARQGDQEHLRISGAGVRRNRDGVRHTGTATVFVEVTDVNDCRPRFLQPSDGQVLKLPVGATAGYSLLEAKAIDSDLHDNGRVSYSLIDATNSGLQIDSSSGTLYVIKSVTRLGEGQPEQFPLTIQARDHGNPSSLSSTVRVWVRIVDSSEYPAASGGPDGASGGGSGGRNAGKDSYSASHRMRATVVIGLIVFFFLLLVLAAAAALVLLRPCRRRGRPVQFQSGEPDSRRSRSNFIGGVDGGVGEKVDDGEEAGSIG